MSEETTRRLEEAKADEAQQQQIVAREKQQYLDALAEQLAGKVEAYGKKLAFEQPEVTKSLGRDGVEAFRRELVEAANGLGSLLRESADKIAWPTFEYDRAKKRGLRSALYDFLAGGRTKPINDVVRSYGYHLDAYHGVSPYELVDDVDSRSVENNLELLTQKRKAVEAAKDADDQDTVADLWQ